MQIHLGTHPDNPISVKRLELDRGTETFIIENDKTLSNNYKSFNKLQNIIDYIFGNEDGDWFLINESSCILQNIKYTMFYIEDKDGDKHTVYFKIS